MSAPPRPDCVVLPGGRRGKLCKHGVRDCCAVAHARVELAGQMDPHGDRPKAGWGDDRTMWWCKRCKTVQCGLVPFMHGGCPQPRRGEGRCGTILLRLSA